MGSYADKPRNAFGPASFTVEDILAGRVHAISDVHFGHGAIVGLAARPGYEASGEHDLHEHERVIAAAWRERVADDHYVLHGGDGAWNSSGVNRIKDSGGLPGIVESLDGNHDMSGIRTALIKKLGWNFIDPVSIEWTISVPVKEKQTDPETGKSQIVVVGHEEHTRLVIISHYPLKNLPEGAVNLHGHVHGNQFPWADHRYKDFSAESVGYGPVQLKGLLDALVLQAVGEGAGNEDAHEAQTLALALANRVV